MHHPVSLFSNYFNYLQFFNDLPMHSIVGGVSRLRTELEKDFLFLFSSRR